MTSSPVEWAGRACHAREEIDALLGQGAGVRRAERTAAILCSSWPGAALYACVLRPEDQAAALDETGRPRPEWAKMLLAAIASPPAPEALSLPGRLLIWEEIRFRNALYGALALAVPGTNATEAEAARAFLTFCAHTLGAGLEIEAREREREALAEESAANLRLADVGETSAPVAHEFNNFLNALLLHIAVLQLKLPEALRPGLLEVRHQAMGAAALIQQFQHYHQRRPSPPGPVDLNKAVRGAIQTLAGPLAERDGGPRATIRLDLAAGELPVPGLFSDLKRLCVFLVRNAAAAAGENGAVLVQTARGGGKVVLRVEDAGPELTAKLRTHLFEPSAAGRDGTSSLELAACKTLVRRLQGVVRAENRPQGGAVFIVELNPAT